MLESGILNGESCLLVECDQVENSQMARVLDGIITRRLVVEVSDHESDCFVSLFGIQTLRH